MKFKCPHCQQHIEADEDLGGITAECPKCKGNFIVPHVVSTESKTNSDSTTMNHKRAKALIPLDAVSKYIPTGRCEYPIWLVLCFPLVVIAAAVSGVLGAFLFYISLFISTILVRQILGPIPAGVVEVCVFLGLNLGYITGIVFFSSMACKKAHNRNVIIGFFYGLLASLTMAVFYGLVWHLNPTLKDQLGVSIYFGLVGQVFSGLIAGKLIVKKIHEDVYCEHCNTYMTNNYCKFFAEPLATIQELAHICDATSLKKLRNVSDTEAQSAIALSTCTYGCYGYLKILQKTISKNEKGQDIEIFVPVVSGVVDSQSISIWGYILST